MSNKWSYWYIEIALFNGQRITTRQLGKTAASAMYKVLNKAIKDNVTDIKRISVLKDYEHGTYGVKPEDLR